MIELTERPLDPEKFTAAVRRGTNGAVVTFLGTTRDNFEGKKVVTLDYEAFDEMALKKLEEVRGELMAEFGLDDVAIGHRTGLVAIGEISLVVAVGFSPPQGRILRLPQGGGPHQRGGAYLEERGLRGRLPLGGLRRPRVLPPRVIRRGSGFCGGSSPLAGFPALK